MGPYMASEQPGGRPPKRGQYEPLLWASCGRGDAMGRMTPRPPRSPTPRRPGVIIAPKWTRSGSPVETRRGKKGKHRPSARLRAGFRGVACSRSGRAASSSLMPNATEAVYLYDLRLTNLIGAARLQRPRYPRPAHDPDVVSHLHLTPQAQFRPRVRPARSQTRFDRTSAS